MSSINWKKCLEQKGEKKTVKDKPRNRLLTIEYKVMVTRLEMNRGMGAISDED